MGPKYKIIQEEKEGWEHVIGLKVRFNKHLLSTLNKCIKPKKDIFLQLFYTKIAK